MAILSLEAEYCIKLMTRIESAEKYLYIVKKVEDNGLCLEDEGINTFHNRSNGTFIQNQAKSVQKSINKKFRDLEIKFESYKESQTTQYETIKE